MGALDALLHPSSQRGPWPQVANRSSCWRRPARGSGPVPAPRPLLRLTQPTWLCAAFLLVLRLVSCCNVTTEGNYWTFEPGEAISSPRDYEGLRLNLLLPAYLPKGRSGGGDFYTTRIAEFCSSTGAKVTIITKSYPDSYKLELEYDLDSGLNFYDLFLVTGAWMPPLVERGQLLNITPLRSDATDEWSDILPSLRSSVSVYKGSDYIVPADGNVVVMVYRKDLLDLHGLAKPESWEDWLAVSSYFRNSVGPGAWTSSAGRTLAEEGGYGACMVAGNGGHETLFAYLATFLQSNGTSQGIFFHPESMDALLNMSAISEALLFYKDMMLASSYAEHPDASDQDVLIEEMQAGKCMMALANVSRLKVIANGSFNVDGSTIAVAPTPGSLRVLDHLVGALVDCNGQQGFCPYAVQVPRNVNGQPPSAGETQLVNRAPYFAGGGFAWGISSEVDGHVRKRQALWDLLTTFVKQTDVVNVTATTEYDMDPFRQSTLDGMVEQGSLARELFLQGGWQEEQLGSTFDTLQTVFQSPNGVRDLKIRHASKYLTDTDQWMLNFFGDVVSVSEAQLQIAERWRSRTLTLGITEQRNIYRAVLDLPLYEEECEEGFEFMSGECKPCNAGMFKDESGPQACTSCEQGRFQPEEGSSGCTDCNTVLPGSHTTFLASTQPGDCVCPPDYFWRLPSENAPASAAFCKKCLDGLICEGGILDGHHRPPEQDEGFAATPPAYPGGEPTAIVICNTGKCPAGLALGQCPDHSSDRACEVCERGYYRSGDDCVVCDGVWWNLTTIFLLVVGLIVACAMLFLYVRRGMGTDRQTTMTVVLVFGMTFSSVQALGAFQKLAVTWVEPIASMHKVLLMFTLQVDLIRPSCVFGVRSPPMQYLGLLAVYPAFATAVLVVCFVARRMKKRSISLEQIVNLEGLILMAGYLSVTVISTVPFQCELNPDKSFSVRSYRSVLCWETSEHSVMVAFSSLAVMVFVVGFMAMIAWATLQYPRRVARKGGTKFLRKFRFLFGRFNANHYYYGVVYAVRNLVIALLPVVLVNTAHLQLLCMMLVIMTTGALQSALWPWRIGAANCVDSVFTIGLACTITGGGMLLEDQDDDKMLQLFLNIVFVLAFGCSALLVLVGILRTVRRERSYGIFLSHHKAGAACLARWFKMVLQDRISSRIFLDSDDVDMLDKILDTTAYDCYNVVVLLTRNTLERIWCAGEIASAFKHGTNVVPIACDDFPGIPDNFLDGLSTLWTAHQVSALHACGVSLSDINVAYRELRRMEKIKLLRHTSTEAQERVVRMALRRCHHVGARFLPQLFSQGSRAPGSSMIFNLDDDSGLPTNVENQKSDTTAVTGTSGGDGKLVILSDLRDPEAICIARILGIYIGRQMQETVVLANSLKGHTYRRAQCLLVLLTRGVLESPSFACFIAAFHDKLGVEVIPIHGDEGFVYPTQEFWTELSAGRVFHQADLNSHGVTIEQISTAYKALFNVLALKFTAHGSELIQRTEVKVITMRLRNFASRLDTSSGSESFLTRFWRPRASSTSTISQEPSIPEEPAEKAEHEISLQEPVLPLSWEPSPEPTLTVEEKGHEPPTEPVASASSAQQSAGS